MRFFRSWISLVFLFLSGLCVLSVMAFVSLFVAFSAATFGSEGFVQMHHPCRLAGRQILAELVIEFSLQICEFLMPFESLFGAFVQRCIIFFGYVFCFAGLASGAAFLKEFVEFLTVLAEGNGEIRGLFVTEHQFVGQTLNLHLHALFLTELLTLTLLFLVRTYVCCNDGTNRQKNNLFHTNSHFELILELTLFVTIDTNTVPKPKKECLFEAVEVHEFVDYSIDGESCGGVDIELQSAYYLHQHIAFAVAQLFALRHLVTAMDMRHHFRQGGA